MQPTDRHMPALPRGKIVLPSERKLCMSQRGASAAEYGLLIAGIAAVIALAVLLFGGSVVELFNQTCVSIQGSGSCA